MHLFAGCFSVALIIIIIHGAESGTCDKTNVCPAIQAMETKLEIIISLLSPPGNIEWTDFHNVGSFIRYFFFSLSLFLYRARHLNLISFTVASASSCKELHDKHK